MNEMVGKVKLVLDDYAGKDLYSDGDVEDTLLDIVKNYPESDYDRIVEEKANWAVLYHLSAMRGNLVEWLEMQKESDTVLEIGAGCGALTGVLAQKTKSVSCVELSKKRSLINAYRHKKLENIDIYVGNFETIEEKLPLYDVVTLIGVLEYARSYIASDTPHFDLLKKAAGHLRPAGRLVLAIENKLGLKYWAGCPEDHTGRFFDSIEGYPTNKVVQTFSRKELDDLLKEAGYVNRQFYYPYPDYKLPSIIYSDEYLPARGSLSVAPCLSGNRMQLFDEAKAYDSILRAGLFPEFANSFLVVAQID